MDLYQQYLIVIKRGNGDLLKCPIEFYQASLAELLAEGQIKQREREKKEQLEFLKSQGILGGK